MPELPEVETVRVSVHRELFGARPVDFPIQTPPRFVADQSWLGHDLTGIRRRGKYLLLDNDAGCVVIHLGMTGQLTFTDIHTPVSTHEHWRAVMCDARGEHVALRLVDPRRFGFVRFHPNHDERTWPGLIGQLGTEPVPGLWDEDTATAALTGRAGQVKNVLLSQKAIAGVGNYIADEALFRARVAPQARNLTPRAARAVAQATYDIVQQSLHDGGVSMRDYVHTDGTTGNAQHRLAVYGRGGQPCLRCGRELHYTQLSGRGTVWCPSCQLHHT